MYADDAMLLDWNERELESLVASLASVREHLCLKVKWVKARW